MTFLECFNLTLEDIELARAVQRYPVLALHRDGSPNLARDRFSELLRDVGMPGVPIDAIAELATIYPPRAVRLECDKDH